MNFLRKILGLGPKVDCHELIANGAVLIDVRTPAEYANGKPRNSKNVPLDKIGGKIGNIKKLNKTVVLVCQSGMRSGRATAMLKREGIDAHNGGGWHNFS